MSAPALMISASFLFAVMGVCVKLASELVKYSGAPERVLQVVSI